MSKFGIPVLAIAAMLAVVGTADAAVVTTFNSAVGVSDTGGLVDSWESILGTQQPTATASGGARPTLEANTFGAGQPGIVFDGSTDLMTFADTGFPTSDWTATVIFQIDSYNTGRPTVVTWGDDQENQFKEVALAVHNFSDGRMIARANGTDANSDILTAGILVDTTYVAVIKKDGNDFRFSVSDGTTAETQTVSNGSFATVLEQGYFGALQGNLVDAGNVKVGYFQIDNSALSDSAQDALRDSLASSTSNWLVPEPATMALLGIGGLMVLRRRRAA